MNVTSILAAKGGNVTTIEPTATLAAAATLLAKHRIGAIIVLGAEGRLVGILSERDIVRTIVDGGCDVLDQPVSQAMTRNVATCGPDEPIHSIMERMTQGKFRHMPVLESGRLTGIISIGDVVKYRLDEMEQESEAMRGYIQTA
jgi:CBS domain-containing protein